MAEPGDFSTLLARVREGDNEAAKQLLNDYEPVLRRIIRMRLADQSLRRLVDPDDICQSVLGSFFVRMALGQYEIDSQDDLLRLLATMVRNKVANQQRRRFLEKRQEMRVPLDNHLAETSAAVQSSPSQSLIYEELMHKASTLLTDEERQLIALRKQGLEWNAIATRLGGSAEGLRKRLARTVDLVVKQLGLDETCRG